jgi:fused signal recognition particle receptor
MSWHDPLLVGLTAWLLLALLASLIVAVGVLLPGRRAASPSAAPGAVASRRPSWQAGLAKTRGSLSRRLLEAWSGPDEREAWLVRVEEVLLGSDVGVKGTRDLLEQLRPRIRTVQTAGELRQVIKTTVRDLLAAEQPRSHPAAKPYVILVVGVNGVGKTTTIGKLAHRHRSEGRTVLLVAADTFRAAAIDQLARWAERVDAGLVKHQPGADPSAVVFDGMQAALARGADVVIIDTAGRLHVKANLMEEVKKIARTIARHVEGAPHEVLLVIDATTGQNAVNQARVFHEALQVSGVALTKLDGTAKGGMALAIRRELGLSIDYVGLGERAEDLAPFDPDAFVAALFPEPGLTDAA